MYNRLMIALSVIKNRISQGGKFWICFSGDSITSCEWVHPNWREIVEYVLKDQLEYDWELKGFNFAYDGATTSDIVNRFSEMLVLKPDLIICMIGANDPFRPVSISEYVKNLKNIKELALKNGIMLILSTDNCPENAWAEAEYEKYVDELKSSGLEFINLFEESKNFPGDRIYTFIAESNIPSERVVKGGSDFWHPNQLGNAYIAKIILKQVFGINFDPELFWRETQNGAKLPRY